MLDVNPESKYQEHAAHVKIRPAVICPHCWHRFPSYNIHWVSVHPNLRNDPRLGTDHAFRFLPTRFDVRGNALDAAGMPCDELACPHCHLVVPRPCLEIAPFFVSIVGTPSCGKSYYLAAMLWQLRKELARKFCISLTDAAPAFNELVSSYEQRLFFNENDSTPLKLEKTEEYGDRYDLVTFGEHSMLLPKPFLYAMRPVNGHPNSTIVDRVSQLLHLYDNAGESFQIGKDSALTPTTRHLVHAKLIMFCFDLTQDSQFRKRYGAQTRDWQLHTSKIFRQDQVFNEMVDRIRNHTGLKQHEKHRAKMIIVLTKSDTWSSLIPDLRLGSITTRIGETPMHALNMQRIEQVSCRCRAMLFEVCPEIVVSAESFCSDVMYIPVSATGRPTDPELGIAPRDIKPNWCHAPILSALARWGGGLIPWKSSGE